MQFTSSYKTYNTIVTSELTFNKFERCSALWSFLRHISSLFVYLFGYHGRPIEAHTREAKKPSFKAAIDIKHAVNYGKEILPLTNQRSNFAISLYIRKEKSWSDLNCHTRLCFTTVYDYSNIHCCLKTSDFKLTVFFMIDCLSSLSDPHNTILAVKPAITWE